MAALDDIEPMLHVGEVVEMAGLLIESAGPAAAIGDFCEISASGGQRGAQPGDRLPRRARAVDAA